jgi:phage shock protein A
VISILIFAFWTCAGIGTFWVLAGYPYQQKIEEMSDENWRATTNFIRKRFPFLESLMTQSTEEKYLDGLIASLEAARLKIHATAIPLHRTMAQAEELQKELLTALEKSNADVSRWHERASLAVTQENDELAKQALEQKLRYQKQAEIFSSILAENKSFIDAMRENLEQVKSAKELFHQRTYVLTLKARHAAAMAQIHRKLAANHRQQALSEINLQILELQGHEDEKLISSSQTLINNLSQIFDEVELEISAMESPVSFWDKNSRPREKRHHDADALKRELDKMKKAQEDDQQTTSE